jgi:transposase InsO family protein
MSRGGFSLWAVLGERFVCLDYPITLCREGAVSFVTFRYSRNGGGFSLWVVLEGMICHYPLDAYLFSSLKEVQQITHTWIQSYNQDCPHDALNGLTPAAYRLAAQNISSFNWP